MAPTPSSARSNQTHFTPCRTPLTKHRLNFHSAAARTPNPDAGGKVHAPPEHPVEVIGRIRDYPDCKDKPVSILQVNPDNQTIRIRAEIGYRDFTLDGVSFSENEDLEAFYKKFVEERIKGVKLGNKCTVMMYGPTGAGKSHTMFGCGKQPGIVYRSLKDILGESDQDGEKEGVTFVQVTVLEIYNEEIYDLLSCNNGSGFIGWPKGGNGSKVKLEVMGKKAKNATFISGTEAGKISKEIQKVEKRRIVKSTLCNDRSSRSHCMIILDVPTVGGRLMLVDMAGSENIDQAGQIGFEAKMQTAKINQGNIALKRVVESIANRDSHVPFRDSKLTMLLQDSFEDDKSKILMVLCASPDPKEIFKTVCTLEYGAKAKCILRGPHSANKDKNGVDESSSAVVLGSRIAAMDEFIHKLQVEKNQKEKERNDAQKQLKKKEEEVAAMRALIQQKEASAASEEEINVKVNERTQQLKFELERKLEECRRMAEEFVEMERRRMEERILQQQEEVEIMRRRLEEIELAFRNSREGNGDETSGFAKKLINLYSDEDPSMVKSMDLDTGDQEPGFRDVNNVGLINFSQPNPSNTLAQKYPDRVCLSTVFEEEENEGEEEEEEKVIVEDNGIESLTSMPIYDSTSSSRKLRIQNIFTLCGDRRELYQIEQPIFAEEEESSLEKPDAQKLAVTKRVEALALESKENYISLDESENEQIEVCVRWESSKENPVNHLITMLKVTKDATLKDLRKLIEIYLGSDDKAFTFILPRDHSGIVIAKEKESTVQATKLPFVNGHAYLASLRPVKGIENESFTTQIENKMPLKPISMPSSNQSDGISSTLFNVHY